MNHFFDSQLIARLIHILSTSSTTGPIYNSIRILSKLSLLQPVQELLVQEEVFESLWSLLSSHHAECQVCLPCMYTWAQVFVY